MSVMLTGNMDALWLEETMFLPSSRPRQLTHSLALMMPLASGSHFSTNGPVQGSIPCKEKFVFLLKMDYDIAVDVSKILK